MRVRVQLERIVVDIELLNKFEKAAEEIVAMPETVQLFENLEAGSGVDAFTALTDFMCPDESATAIRGVPMFRRRRNEPEDDWVARSSAQASPGSQPPPRQQRQGGGVPRQSRRRRDEDDTETEKDKGAVSAMNGLIQTLVTSADKFKIYYAPNTSAEVREVIRLANRTIDQIATLESFGRCIFEAATGNTTNDSFFNLDLFVGFETEEELVKDAMYKELTEVLAGVVFHNVSEDGKLPADRLQYSIRQHELKVPRTDRNTWFRSRPGPGGSEGFMYYYGGFVRPI